MTSGAIQKGVPMTVHLLFVAVTSPLTPKSAINNLDEKMEG